MFVIDCKGGADSRRIADRFRRVLRAAGARNLAVWPDEASLSLWALPPAQLTTTLVDMIEHGGRVVPHAHLSQLEPTGPGRQRPPAATAMAIS